MSICFEKGIFATIGTIEGAIIDLTEYCNVKAENGEKFRVIYDRLLQKCPKLHTDEEHKQLSKQFINDFIKEFSHRELRIWFEVHAPMTFGDQELADKYYNLLKIHNAFVYKWLEDNNLILKVDVYLFGNRVKDAYKESGIDFDVDGFACEYTVQLWGLVKTIRDSGYKKTLIDSLQNPIKTLLEITGGHYYNTIDLTNKENLKELYYCLCEVICSSDGFQGKELFHSYNGYGDTIFTPTGEIINEY